MKDLEKLAEEPQYLLFDTSPKITPQKTQDIQEAFYSQGYCVYKNITDAKDFLHEFISSLDTEKLPLFKNNLDQMQLAKHDKLPVCHDIVHTGFQALHYDMGQPFLADQDQTLYTISALWRPANTPANPKAKTRLVSLEKLLEQNSFGNLDEIKTRFTDYIKNHGDGWIEPEPHNTHRLACFARVIDAVSGLNLLTGQIDTMIGQVFAYDKNLDGKTGLQQEQDYFAKAGLNLEQVEEQIELLPGELLIFDNLRVVHGRIGERKARELENFIYGIKKASKQDIDAYREWLLLSSC